MGLPVELRIMILKHVLPNQDIVRPRVIGTQDHPPDLPWGHDWKSTLRMDTTKSNSAVLRLNRQLYEEGLPILYDRTFEVVLSSTTKHFVDYCWPLKELSPLTRSEIDRKGAVGCSSLQQGQTFPFSVMRKLRITLWPTEYPTYPYSQREVITKFCEYDLQWGQLVPKSLEVNFEHGPLWSFNLSDSHNMHGDEWIFEEGADILKRLEYLNEMLKPLTFTRGMIEEVSFSLPSHSKCPKPCSSAMRDPSCSKWHKHLADLCQSSMLQKGPRNEKSFDQMMSVSDAWWESYKRDEDAQQKTNAEAAADSGNE